MEKAALILEGGALRSFFSSAVVDTLLKNNIEIEYVNGVSAGAMVGLNYITKQIGRSKDVNLHYLKDKRYVSLRNYFLKSGIFDLDFLFSDDLNSEFPLDTYALHHSNQILEVTATNVLNGEPKYFRETNDQQLFEAIKASASMPLASKIRYINNVPYLDGGVADSIPVLRAKALGYQKVVVVLTRDPAYRKENNSNALTRISQTYYRHYPDFLNRFASRPRHYNRRLELLNQMSQNGDVFIIQPTEPVDVARIEQDPKKLIKLYQHGEQVMNEQLVPLINYLHH